MGLSLGEGGWCSICSKEREHVRNHTCLDCRVHHQTATEDERTAYEYGQELYRQGFLAGQNYAFRWFWDYEFGGVVQDAGGGMVTILVARDTPSYPSVGDTVQVAVVR